MRRRCSSCKKEKEASEFSRHPDPRCLQCHRERAARRRREQPEAVRATEQRHDTKRRKNPQHKAYKKKWTLASMYGLSVEKYNELLKQQRGRCAICGVVATRKNTRWGGLNIDHDHKTGKVRGLLCTACNGGLGFFHDNIEKMLKAIEYLKRSRD